MAQADKTHGYVTEVTYPFHYYRELNPHIQTLALTVAGVAAPTRPDFTYIELGCGLALSTLVHAAANPEAQFYATDINPDYLAVARGIAADAGIGNVHFLEIAFEDMLDAGLPQFDFVAMHGIWSWINDVNRQHILKFITRFLKPGGATYVSYNAKPGYSPIAPLRELMMLGYRQKSGTVFEKVEAGLAYGQRIRRLDAAFFRANPLMGKHLDDIMRLGRDYLTHEYFNADWWSFFVAEVAGHYAGIGLSLAASAHLMDMLDRLNFTPEMHRAVAELEDPIERETLKDLILNRSFRRDVFTRDAARLPDTNAALTMRPFAAAVLPANVHRVAGMATFGEVRPQADIATALATALAEGPATVAEMMTRAAFAQFSTANVLQSLLVMAGLGAAEPALPTATLAVRKERIGKLNRLLWERALRGDDVSVIASPVTGGAVGLPKAEQLFLLARLRGDDPVALVAGVMPDQQRETIAMAYSNFEAARIPLLRNLGIA